VHPLGVYGVGLAMIACELALLPFAISKTCQILNQSVKTLIVDSLQLRTVRQTVAEYCHRAPAKVG